MFVGLPEGNYDRILDFSTAVTGSLYFVPSLEVLEGLSAIETAAVDSADASPGSATGSLGYRHPALAADEGVSCCAPWRISCVPR